MTNILNGIHVSGEGPVVVLLHSALSSSIQWKVLCNELNNNFTVVNVDILGYGEADAVECESSYSLSVETKRIQKALALLNLNNAYHIAGHSCGGAIALKLAVENPNKLLSLALYEPVAFHLLEEKKRRKSDNNAIISKHVY